MNKRTARGQRNTTSDTQPQADGPDAVARGRDLEIVSEMVLYGEEKLIVLTTSFLFK